MGSPISPIIANLFMEIFENNVLSDLSNNVICNWFRYITDITHLSNLLNSYHNSIEFKFEIENNNSLPFLDCLVIKDQVNFRPIFKIYRKPTHSRIF